MRTTAAAVAAAGAGGPGNPAGVLELLAPRLPNWIADGVEPAPLRGGADESARRAPDDGDRGGGPPPEPVGARRAGDDSGVRVVRALYRAMGIAPAWGQTWDRGFVWWGHEHAQRVRADPPLAGRGAAVVRVHAETDLLRGPPSPAAGHRCSPPRKERKSHYR
jgi:hypothetical protein